MRQLMKNIDRRYILTILLILYKLEYFIFHVFFIYNDLVWCVFVFDWCALKHVAIVGIFVNVVCIFSWRHLQVESFKRCRTFRFINRPHQLTDSLCSNWKRFVDGWKTIPTNEYQNPYFGSIIRYVDLFYFVWQLPRIDQQWYSHSRWPNDLVEAWISWFFIKYKYQVLVTLCGEFVPFMANESHFKWISSA